MTIPTSTISIIQKTGAFAHKATAALHDVKTKAAAALAKAITNSASTNVEMDTAELLALNEIAKLTNRLEMVERELVSIYQTALHLSKTGTAKSASSVVKVKVEAAAIVPEKVKKTNRKAMPRKGKSGGNSGKLLSALQKVLNDTEFKPFKHTELSKKAGIPMGSMAAAVKSLLTSNALATNGQGGYRLAADTATPVVVSLVSGPSKAAPKAAKKAPAKKASPKKGPPVAAVATVPAKAKAISKKSSRKSPVTKAPASDATTVDPITASAE